VRNTVKRVGLYLLVLAQLIAAPCSAAEPVENVPGQATVSASAAPASFDIWEYRVQGNTRLETTRIERAVYPFLGPKLGLEHIEKARVALEQEFRSAGYPTVFVDIPEQNVVGGIVTLQVTEGRVDRLHVSGAQYHSPRQIRAEVPSLASGEVPHLPVVKQQLETLSRESADRQVTPVMRAGRTPGTLDVELQVSDQLPLHGSMEVNGRNTEDTSRLRTMGLLRYDNLWQKYHSSSLIFQLSPEETSEVKVFAATYALPAGQQNRLAFYAVKSDSQSQVATAGALTVIGDGTILGSRLVMPLPVAEDYTHTGTFGFDYKDFNDGTELIGADTTTAPITYLNFMARYDAVVRGEQQLTSFGTGINFSIRDLVSEQSEFDDKRAFSQADYAYLKADLKQERKLPNELSLITRLEGQLTDMPLISNEQYSAGGVESVRGYYESQLLGDNALSASIELQTGNLIKNTDWLKSSTGQVFLDGAWLHIINALPGEPQDSYLYGTGVGMNLRAADHLVSDLYLAWALRDAGSINKGDARADFRIAYEF
jgi:hemolysin activation/secretion protein